MLLSRHIHHTPKPPHAPKPHAEPQTQLTYDRMMPNRYSCGDDGEIMAKQSINKEQVMLTANLAKLKFNSPSITLHQVASPSGVRFINDANPASTLAWHLAGDQALFTVNWTDGQEYSASCQKL